MSYIRRLIYKWGFRPKPHTIFFSPSLHLLSSRKDGKLKRYNAEDGRYY